MIKQFATISIFSLLLIGCTGSKPILGINDSKLTPCPSSPNCVNTQAKDKDHFIAPIFVKTSSPLINETLVKILNELDEATITETKENYIRAEFLSKVFGFVDDVEFYFPATNENETTIHMRSASRLGYSDLGANRKRMEEIRKRLLAQ